MLARRETKKGARISIFLAVVLLVFKCDVITRSQFRAFAQENEAATVQTESQTKLSDIKAEIQDGFSYVFPTLLSVRTQKPSDSTLNPNNDFLEIPRYLILFEPRPDLYLEFRRLELMAKPRWIFEWSRWEDGSRSGDTDTDDELFMNEWRARLRVIDGLFASYGRENLQWGPSYLLSPSNPFFRDNGLRNPKAEVPGKDFARLVWVPGSDWSFSLIANVDEGRQELITEDFESIYALKIDYTGYRKYASLIASYRENDRARLGAYTGWTVSDALLVYGEGTIAQGSNALYPVENPSAPLGIEMLPTKEDSTSPEGILLLGASYTLQAGPTLTAEYLFNGEGYDDDEADLYFELRKRASEAFILPEPAASLGQSVLNQTLDPGLRFLRQNYLMVQYRQSRIWDVLNIVFRYTYNLDDNSSQLIPIIEYDVGDRIQLFLVGRQNFGSTDSEFRSVMEYFYSLGVSFTF
jgi:hypothetical protein